MKRTVITVVCILAALSINAQENSKKVGIIQVSKIIKAHWNYDTIKERVQNKQSEVEGAFTKIQGEGRNILEKLKSIDEELKNPLLNDAAKNAKLAEKKELQKEVKKKSLELDRARRQLTQELRNVEQDEMNTLLKSILDEVSAYGKKHGYSYIQDASATPGRMSPVVYYDSGLEITDEIIKVINAGHETTTKVPETDAKETPEKKSE